MLLRHIVWWGFESSYKKIEDSNTHPVNRSEPTYQEDPVDMEEYTDLESTVDKVQPDVVQPDVLVSAAKTKFYRSENCTLSDERVCAGSGLRRVVEFQEPETKVHPLSLRQIPSWSPSREHTEEISCEGPSPTCPKTAAPGPTSAAPPPPAPSPTPLAFTSSSLISSFLRQHRRKR